LEKILGIMGCGKSLESWGVENPWNHGVWKILGIMGCGIGVYKG